MDTWATSSLSPQIVSHWDTDQERHEKLFPMDVRPQSHEIIRTWAFYTIAKAWLHEKKIPWKNVVISGWILDPDRKKMSKSRGNVVTPQHLLEQYSSDAVRYWAARARLGVDTAFDEQVFKNGRKLTTKLFNASKFALSHIERIGSADSSSISEPLDLALIAELKETIRNASEAFEKFDYAAALQVSESFFWSFCDHYLELVKGRAYDEQNPSGQASAAATLEFALQAFLRLFAPFLPFVTEEIWSWHFSDKAEHESIHLAPWPSENETEGIASPSHQETLKMAAEILSSVRLKKSTEQKTLKWPVSALSVVGPEDRIAAIELIRFGYRKCRKTRTQRLGP